MNEATHDWRNIFKEVGLLNQSVVIGILAQETGHALAVILFFASILGLIMTIYGHPLKSIVELISYGAFISLPYLLITARPPTEWFTSLVLLLPIIPNQLSKALNRSPT
jgi:hypothetical protein